MDNYNTEEIRAEIEDNVKKQMITIHEVTGNYYLAFFFGNTPVSLLISKEQVSTLTIIGIRIKKLL